MLFFNQANLASFETEFVKSPTNKKGRPLPTPNKSAKINPLRILALAVATDNNSSNGAADVPKLKIKPYKNDPSIPGLRKDSSCLTRK